MRLQITWASTLVAASAIALPWAGSPLMAQERADLFAQLDANKDGYVSADELPAEQRAKFERLLKLAGKEKEQKLNKALFEGAVKAAKEGAKGVSDEAPPAAKSDSRASDGDDLFAKLDANKDGVVAAEEVSGAQKPDFERLLKNGDIDGDGKLSRDEYTASTKATETPRLPGRGGAPGQARPGGPPINPRELFGRFDRNQDGKLSKDELPPRMQENFDRIDANSDGNVSEEEFGRVAGLGQRPPGAGGFPPPGMPPAGLFALLDTDRDGEISTAEIVGAGSALLKLDRNSDGKLTPDEVFGPGGMPPARSGEGRPEATRSRPPEGRPAGPESEAFRERLKQADANRDGKLSKDEAPERLRENFDRLDGNRDGVLDETELRQVIQRLDGGPRP